MMQQLWNCCGGLWCPHKDAGTNALYVMLIPTGCLAPQAPMVIPGSQYSNFISV